MGGMVFPGCTVAVVGSCITKCDTLSWFDLARFCTTIRVSEEDYVMFNESSSKNRKSSEFQTDVFRLLNSKCYGAIYWNHLEVSILILRGGTPLLRKTSTSGVHALAHPLWMRDDRQDGCWDWSTLKVTVAIMIANSVAKRKPMQNPR